MDTITFDGSRITVPYPIRGFPEFPGAFTFCGESDTFVPTGGAENPFAGFWITDEVCGTFERPTPFPG